MKQPNLSPKAQYVAGVLRKHGFRYCEKQFLFLGNCAESAGDWLIGGAYQELGLDAVCEGQLFFKELPENCDRTMLESEVDRIKALILETEKESEGFRLE
ncbi:hypothetical protein ACE1CD_15685 [Aerosakkonema sp. BLCC-F183]|uniref:hypothetical protein n=1 Tax=Aerosakkonema sp. BLCC-F183 TaxID=3342834 RepID=UPI0035B7AEF7